MKPKSVRSDLEISPKCPWCRALVYVAARPRLGDAVLCLKCGTALEVVNTRPITVDFSNADDKDDGFTYFSEDVT